MSREVYITGMGAISPIGHSAASSFEAAANGVCGIARPTLFDAELTEISVAGEVKDFDPTVYIKSREAKRMARFAQFAVSAAVQAWEDGGIAGSDYDSGRIGVVLGSGMGGFDVICEQHDELRDAGPRAVSSLFVPKSIINCAAGLISMRLGLHGPCYSIVTACASGSDAIGHAYYAVKEGRLDAVLVGGAEAAMAELSVQGFHQMQALSESKDPKRASLPFDKDRGGFVIAEGAAFMLIETAEHAKKRGAKPPYAIVSGYAQTCDAYHITAPMPDGAQAARAMELAVSDAGIDKSEIGYINAHGTGTPLNDVGESKAIEKCFGDHAKKLLVSSTKSMTGHMLGAAGAFELVLTAYALQKGIAPPTIGLEVEGEGCDLDYVKGKAKKLECEYAMSNSFGFGGHNSCVVLKKYTGE
ncbi:MAG: beta-ketoacyl-ACP synthase II [Christensenellales bacterium]|jgi:3-oxoacyl-[acyl-carrier-protein] synthase II